MSSRRVSGHGTGNFIAQRGDNFVEDHRLEAVGFRAVEDSVELVLVPVPASAAALAALDTVETSPQLRVEQLEAICAVAHLGLATRTQVEQFLGGRDCELLLRRLVDRGILEHVVRDTDMAGAPSL